MQKERMRISEATKIVTGIRETLCQAMERLKLPIAEGQVDLDGRLLTRERLETFRRELDEVTWEALKEYFDIVENDET